MSESQTPRTDAEIKRIYCNMELAPEFGMSLPGQIMLHAQRLETELTATRARLAELEGIAERLYRQIGSKENDDTVPAMLAYEAYKEGKK